MWKALFAGILLSAAVFAGVATAGASSADATDEPYANNSVVTPDTIDATSTGQAG